MLQARTRWKETHMRKTSRTANGRSVMQQLRLVGRFMEQPLVIVLGVLSAAGVAKSGHGAWAAGGIVTFILIYLSAVVTLTTIRRLAASVRHAAYRTPGTSRTVAVVALMLVGITGLSVW